MNRIWVACVRGVCLLIPFSEPRRRTRKSLLRWQRNITDRIISKRELKKFLKHVKNKPAGNSVLVVEANPHHGEVLPGVVKYFRDLGYDVDLVVRLEVYKDKPFIRHSNPPKTFCMDAKYLTEFFKSDLAEKYNFVYFSSMYVYTHAHDGAIMGLIGGFPKKYIIMEHALDRHPGYAKPEHAPHVVTMAGLGGFPMLNPNYFGEINITPRSKKTHIVACARTLSEGDIIFTAVRELLARGIKDFHVTIAGRSSVRKIPSDVKNYVKLTGMLSFNNLWKLYEDADFFFNPLEPQIESHRKYLDKVTSGYWQAIMAFGKVPISHVAFAPIYRYNDENALLYDVAGGAADAMERAIKLSNDEYLAKQNALFEMRDQVYNSSMENIKTVIKNLGY